MPRRVSLPGADELFRATRTAEVRAPAEIADRPATADSHSGDTGQPDAGLTHPRPVARRARPSGRVRHDEKITIYVTADELLTLEHTRLALRAQHGVAVDRGRIVREAIHLALLDVAEHGDDSALVRRLRSP